MKIYIKKEKAMPKMSYLLSFLFISTLISGCGDSDKQEHSTTLTNRQSSQIKITENAVDRSIKDEKSKNNSGQFYYSYNKENNNSTDKTVGRRTTIDAYLNIKSPYERVRITMMIKRLSNDYIIKCSACHDDYANGVIGPSLLGKDADFIYKKIIAFKTGKKKNVLMKELVTQLDDKKLRSIAKEIANFNKEIEKFRSKK